MKSFNDILEKIKHNKNNHNKGYFNCIPFQNMDRLEQYLPGIEPATYYLITSGTGNGKSKLVRSLFMHQPFEYLDKHPESNIKLDILYFSLEESEEKIILAEISKYLFNTHNLIVSIKDLQSIGRYNTISVDTLKKIEEGEKYVNNFLSRIKIITNQRNATGIYKTVRNFALEIGTYYDSNNNPLSQKEITNIINGIGDDFKKISYYKTNHPRHFVIVIVDHISLLLPENHLGRPLDLRQSINLFSNQYCLQIRDRFGFTPVIVQQQMAAKEAIEVNFKGDTLDQKLEPSMEGLGDSKLTSRDANIVLGLFAPNRFGIKESYGYDIRRLKDNFRLLSILKNRDGDSNIKVPLFFNGAVDFFSVLPKVDDKEGIQKVYTYLNKIRRNDS